ncbi:NAD(P)H-binding protein [Dyadobacter sp. CY345]|uniref:NmrA family NAD(P)-binding protein n=1 Tax=Dyadobacter sp. CY345 TaxID=2909335 RepID=UPI001F3C6714|nr:NAD(P)H-binding protein [Dyadobacter sp. CY345]MCF2443463.1 NAD(P)H-binding protein [Dyadobacter sp. CY345]
MKITLTGSLGHIGKPLAEKLLQKGHSVTVISSNEEKRKDIQTLGAEAAIGSLQDAAFLKASFTGSDVVYTMVPPANYFDQSLDLMAYYREIGDNFAYAIQESGVERVINLSTIGGELEKGSGILLGAHGVEEILDKLPQTITVIHIRPTSFYYNLYGYVEIIKNAGAIITNYGNSLIPWVSPIDIADVVAEEIESGFLERKVRYVASEELTGPETARILGAVIGKPDLQWKIVSDEQVQQGLEGAGMNPEIAAGLVEMYGALQSGLLAADYHRNKPAILGNVKMEDFAREFALAFK